MTVIDPRPALARIAPTSPSAWEGFCRPPGGSPASMWSKTRYDRASSGRVAQVYRLFDPNAGPIPDDQDVAVLQLDAAVEHVPVVPWQIRAAQVGPSVYLAGMRNPALDTPLETVAYDPRVGLVDLKDASARGFSGGPGWVQDNGWVQDDGGSATVIGVERPPHGLRNDRDQ